MNLIFHEFRSFVLNHRDRRAHRGKPFVIGVLIVANRS
jgi:hypothetical protein